MALLQHRVEDKIFFLEQILYQNRLKPVFIRKIVATGLIVELIFGN
jgi:hypothetical protein